MGGGLVSEYRIKQDGLVVAGCSGDDDEHVISQAMHYARVYSGDAPITTVEVKTNGKWRKFIEIRKPESSP